MLLSWVVIFLIIAIIAGLFGFSGIAKESTSIARLLFFIFLILFFITWLQGNGFLDSHLNLFSSK